MVGAMRENARFRRQSGGLAVCLILLAKAATAWDEPLSDQPALHPRPLLQLPVEPVAALLIGVGIIGKHSPVDEIVAEIAHRTLHFALCLRAVGPARARREAPVMGEAEKLEGAHERASLQPQIAR